MYKFKCLKIHDYVNKSKENERLIEAMIRKNSVEGIMRNNDENMRMNEGTSELEKVNRPK